MKEPSARLSITQVLLQNTSLPMILFHGAEYGMYNKRFEKDNKERLRVSHCLASGNTAENAGFSKEPDRSDETKDGQPGRGPQNGREVIRRTDGGGILLRSKVSFVGVRGRREKGGFSWRKLDR